MPRIAVSEVLDAPALRADSGAPELPGGMSGSLVLGAVTDHDAPGVVKVTAPESAGETRRAQRELEVCRELSRRLPGPAVEDAGGTVVAGPYEFPGGRRFEFTDPSGNRLGAFADS